MDIIKKDVVKEPSLYMIENNFAKAEISDFGATLVSFFINGKNIILGYPELSRYKSCETYLGATVGRYANRISNAEFTLNGKKYALTANDKKHTLHGGITGFSKKIWEIINIDKNSIRMSIKSKDGEGGFPGNMYTEVSFSITENRLIIDYFAVSDKDTPICLTNHSYFNLDGENNVENTILQINAGYVSITDEDLIPTGKINVTDSPFDFRHPKKIGQDINTQNKYLKMQNGYDCNFFLNGIKAATAFSEKNKLMMNVYTDMPCLQLYTGNFLSGSEYGRAGNLIGFRSGFCLETQFAPDSPHAENFGGCLLEKGEEFRTKTVFEFYIK